MRSSITLAFTLALIVTIAACTREPANTAATVPTLEQIVRQAQ